MKTKLFQIKWDPSADPKMAGDLAKLLSLSKSSRERCLAELAAILSARTKAQEWELISKVLASVPEPGGDVASGLRFLMGITKETFTDADATNDSPESIGDDLIALKLVNEDQRSIVVGILETIQGEVVPSVRGLLQQRRVTQGVGPSLASFGHSVELRLMPVEPWTTAMAVDSYTPKVGGIVGVASLLLRTDDGESFFFQAAREELELLIGEIRAALKDLTALEQALPASPSSAQKASVGKHVHHKRRPSRR